MPTHCSATPEKMLQLVQFMDPGAGLRGAAQTTDTNAHEQHTTILKLAVPSWPFAQCKLQPTVHSSCHARELAQPALCSSAYLGAQLPAQQKVLLLEGCHPHLDHWDQILWCSRPARAQQGLSMAQHRSAWLSRDTAEHSMILQISMAEPT